MCDGILTRNNHNKKEIVRSRLKGIGRKKGEGKDKEKGEREPIIIFKDKIFWYFFRTFSDVKLQKDIMSMFFFWKFVKSRSNIDSFNLAPRPDFRGWPRLRSRFFGCQKEFFTLARRK